MSRGIFQLFCSCAAALVLGPSSLALADGAYRLPWPPGTPMELTQDCNDSYYADHIGSGGFAWDFANGTHFAVSAARAGTVTHLKMSSRSGCNTSSCVDTANYLVIDHGDGSASVYLHLDADSLDPQIRCGQSVSQGQHIANAGSTGWSTGPHLHYQVNAVHGSATTTCECGPDGKACAEDFAAWPAFWSSQTYPSQPVMFEEWPATACADRRMVLPLSRNATPAPLPSTPLRVASVAGVGGADHPDGDSSATATAGSAASSKADTNAPSATAAGRAKLAAASNSSSSKRGAAAALPSDGVARRKAAASSRPPHVTAPTAVGGKRSTPAPAAPPVNGTARPRRHETPPPSAKELSSAPLRH